MLEPCEGKLSCTVLRGESGSNTADLLDKPADVEQREGRIIRQGNENDNVDIFRYVTKGTFDSYSWQILENKQKFISQIMTSKNPARTCEDMDGTALEYAEIKALATGDPRYKERMNLEVDVTKLRVLEQDFLSAKYDYENKILKDYPEQIKVFESRIDGCKKGLEILEKYPKDNTSDNFAVIIDGNLYTEKESAGKLIIDSCKSIGSSLRDFQKVGEFKGFDLFVRYDPRDGYLVNLKNGISLTGKLSDSPTGLFMTLQNMLGSIPAEQEKATQRLITVKNNLETAKASINEKFPYEFELLKKEALLSKITKELEKEALENTKVRKTNSDKGKSLIDTIREKKSQLVGSSDSKDRDMEL